MHETGTNIPPAIQHVLCPLHLACRFIDEGMPETDAWSWAIKVETILKPHLYPNGCIKETA